MNAIKEYIYSTMKNDATLAALATGGIFYNRPMGGTVDWSKPRVTYFLSDRAARDPLGDVKDETYQIDIWSRDPDVNDQIAGRVDALFVDQPMSLLTRRVDVVKDAGEFELYEDDIQVHHKMKQLRVISVPL